MIGDGLTQSGQFVSVGRVDDVDVGLQFELASRFVDPVELDDGVAEGRLHLVRPLLEDRTCNVQLRSFLSQLIIVVLSSCIRR